MSNPLAIAAVTAALRNLLSQSFNSDPEFAALTGLSGIEVTVRPPDKARSGLEAKTQVNLFLYAATPNAAWRNSDLPRQVRPGETGLPPLSLDLSYLLTAYGANDEDVNGHKVLGWAMRLLHDTFALTPAQLQAAVPGSDVHLQVERVRLTPVTLSGEEMSKLWTSLQANYRLSTAYQASVVLIESARPSRTPLPVLTRGPADAGVAVQPSLLPPFPTLESVQATNRQPAAALGDTLTFSGHHLDGDTVALSFSHPRLPSPLTIPALAGATAVSVQAHLPSDPVNWPAGLWAVTALVTRAGQTHVSNALPLALAPAPTGLPLAVARDGDGDAIISLGSSPQARLDQRVTLLLGSQEVLAQPRLAQAAPLQFIVRAATPGVYRVRLRVDGVDSLLIDYTAAPPAFRPDQQVTIT